MERVQSRRRINAGGAAQENDPMAARIASKSIIPKPTSRTALVDVINQPARPVLAAKTNALKKAAAATAAPAKPLATTRAVFGVVNKEKESLLKPSAQALKKQVSTTTITGATRKWQIKKDAPETEDMKKLAALPKIQNIKIKDIAKAFNSGQIIKRTSDNDIAILKGIHDVDLEDDPQLVSEYISDIIRYLLHLEDKYPIPKLHLKGHRVTEKYRSVLINWLADVVDSFKLTKETLHMSVSLVDRYIAVNPRIAKDTLQLVGIVAMFITHKYEETNIIEMDDWLYICDNAFTRKEILDMEMHMLAKMDFSLGRPTAITFLRRFHKVVSATLRQHELGKYLIELALMEYEMCAVKPSVQAAAACCLARWLLEVEGGKPQDGWCDLLAHYSGYKYADIAETVTRYAVMVERAETVKQQSIRKLYSEEKRQRIALDEVLRGAKLKSLRPPNVTVTIT